MSEFCFFHLLGSRGALYEYVTSLRVILIFLREPAKRVGTRADWNAGDARRAREVRVSINNNLKCYCVCCDFHLKSASGRRRKGTSAARASASFDADAASPLLAMEIPSRTRPVWRLRSLLG
jgi:hypothetical protein